MISQSKNIVRGKELNIRRHWMVFLAGHFEAWSLCIIVNWNWSDVDDVGCHVQPSHLGVGMLMEVPGTSLE